MVLRRRSLGRGGEAACCEYCRELHGCIKGFLWQRNGEQDVEPMMVVGAGRKSRGREEEWGQGGRVGAKAEGKAGAAAH